MNSDLVFKCVCVCVYWCIVWCFSLLCVSEFPTLFFALSSLVLAFLCIIFLAFFLLVGDGSCRC